MTDFELVHRAAAGDSAAQGELARRSFRRVLAYFRARVSHLSDAEELTQETLLRAVVNLSSLEDHASYDAWLRGIAGHLCSDWYRRKRIVQNSLSESEPSDDCSPLEHAAMADESVLIQRRIMELPDELREVVFLFYYEEYTYEQMADWLGVARATVSERLSRARDLLKSRLSSLRSCAT